MLGIARAYHIALISRYRRREAIAAFHRVGRSATGRSPRQAAARGGYDDFRASFSAMGAFLCRAGRRAQHALYAGTYRLLRHVADKEARWRRCYH